MKGIFVSCLFVTFGLIDSNCRNRTPECELRGLSMPIEWDNCEVVIVRVSACRGFCRSHSDPSDHNTIEESRGRHNFTAYSECCSIAATERVPFTIRCNGVSRMESIMSATDCRCGACQEG